MDTATAKPSLLHTIGAIPLALVTWALVSTIATLLWYLLNSFFTFIRPEILGFLASIIGSVIGVIAAQALSESWLPRYSRKTVAVFIIAFSAIIIACEWLVFPNPAHPITTSAGAVATIWTAYQAFWRGLGI